MRAALGRRYGSPFYARIRFGLMRPRFPVLGSSFAGQVEGEIVVAMA
jgi:hypothetical protein